MLSKSNKLICPNKLNSLNSLTKSTDRSLLIDSSINLKSDIKLINNSKNSTNAQMTFKKCSFNSIINSIKLSSNLNYLYKSQSSIRSLSTNSIQPDLSKSKKDPFFEFDGLSKRKSRSRCVFAWGLSATGAVGNTRYFTTEKLKYEKILKPFRIKYFNNMKVS